jgi:hypothetical protein
MNLKQDVEGIHSIIDSSSSYAVNKRRKKKSPTMREVKNVQVD